MMQGRKLNTWLPLLFSLVMIVGMTLGYKLRENTAKSGSFFKLQKAGTVQEVVDLIKLEYVDPISPDSLVGVAIQQMLNKLDPHSIYIPAVTVQDVNEDLQGNFQGIGVEFNIFDDTVHVITVLENGPSDKAGLKVGDRFIKVSDSLVAGNGISTTRIRKLLRGPGASEVAVSVLRDNKPVQLTIRRGTIPLPSVDAAYMTDKQTGFIHINKFSETTYEEFMTSLEKLQKEGMTKLVLDLRDNGGGILEEAIDIADEFLDDNKLIVYTQGNKNPRQEYHCKRPGLFETGKLVVLVDEGTASASEVLVGALQDWDRAEVIGRRTFGKGLVQKQYELSDGSALRLTIARYYTPSGRSIQKSYSNGEDDYDKDLLNRYQHGDMVNADSNHFQIGEAFKTKSGRTVYGGGGIMPDVFVSADTATISTGLARLYGSNTMNNFAYRYFMSHRNTFNTTASPVDLYRQYKDSQPLWNEFAAFATKDSLNINLLPSHDREMAQQRLIALMARQRWRSNGFFEVLNANDSTVHKALEVVGSR